MVRCDVCGREEGMPYRCDHCGGSFCAEHRLPENHDCPGLENWDDPGGVFDSGFDASVEQSGRNRDRDWTETIPVDTSVGGPLGYVRGNMTYVFLAAMWLMFVIQYVVAPLLGVPLRSMAWLSLFTVNTVHPLYVWSWVIAVFAHGGFTHIFFNSIVLYFFGPVVEQRVGTREFSALFIVSGIVAGLAQVLATMLTGGTAFVLGASGAIASLFGVLTVLNPNLRIYLYFIIPMPLWVATLLFAAYSVFVSTFGGIGAGGVAQFAHLAGLGIGLAYGMYLKAQGAQAPQQLQFGGGGRGPGGGGRRRI
ncbi:MAG: rhomboid family intramembrane serine protease [Halodesulfurarchaeum sp.]